MFSDLRFSSEDTKPATGAFYAVSSSLERRLRIIGRPRPCQDQFSKLHVDAHMYITAVCTLHKIAAREFSNIERK